MATYAAAKAKHATLTASTVDTVTLSNCSNVEVLNRGTTELYFTVDGTTPTVAGDNCYIVQAGAALQVPGSSPTYVQDRVAIAVKVISSAAVAYSVTGF